ncbi:hypothetical protein IJV79_03680, partial [bacterium]|nr:hypothetical protein [bacterium]
ISNVQAAVQSLLITLTNATFMIPMAISNAISVKVGFENGAGNFEELKKYAYSGITLSVCFMSFCAIVFFLFPQYCIGIFSQDAEVLRIAVPILVLVGLCQVFDGLQISVGGVFKGLKNTQIMMWGIFIAYWVIGLPMGFLFAFKFNMELYGFWIGISLSIATLGIGLFTVMRKTLHKKGVQG